ncbi:MAG TPA: CHAT domain-containing protein [Anaerolineae bacterium]
MGQQSRSVKVTKKGYLPDQQNVPVNLQLRIRKREEKYEATILAEEGAQPRRVSINMSSNDLAGLNKLLHKKMQEVALEHIDGGLTPADLKDQVRRLAEVGHLAFRKVFGSDELRNAIRLLLNSNHRNSIQVTSEDFFLPWELLYPISPGESLDYKHFWGMNHIISRFIVVEDPSPNFNFRLSPSIRIASRPKLGLFTDYNLPSVLSEEMPYFKKLHEDDKIHLFEFRDLDPTKKLEGIQLFKAFWQNDFDLVHFACHALYEDEAAYLSHISLSKDFHISLVDFETYEIAINGYPLIIVNACETGHPNPLYTASFATTFLKNGARGVLATECSIPDAFAAEFSKQLYPLLLSGKTLGESVLETRRCFLSMSDNPTGLLYSIYGSPLIRLHNQRQGEKNGR